MKTNTWANVYYRAHNTIDGPERNMTSTERAMRFTVFECVNVLRGLIIRNGDTEHNRALRMGWDEILEQFGLTISEVDYYDTIRHQKLY